MTTETELLLLLYALYLWDCIHWLNPGQVAFLRAGNRWQRRQLTTHSFTLLNRLPILRNPASMRPGLIVCNEGGGAALAARRVRATIRLLDRQLMLLSLFATMSATYLLLILPAVILLGRFVVVWKPLGAMVLLLHITVVVEFYRTAKAWRIQSPRAFWEAFAASALNPLSALRAPDQIMLWTFARTTPAAIETAVDRSSPT
jgi:hypothetical protein